MNWEQEQFNNGIPVIERTYKVQKPNGGITQVNRWLMNLTMSTDPSKIVQCADYSFEKAKDLKIINN